MTVSIRIQNATLATLQEDSPEPYGLIPNGTVVITEGVIEWVGPTVDCPAVYSNTALADYSGYLITPALIDCHTHIVHGGSRAHEFEMRQKGTSYEAIAIAGGGIVSTVAATRAASDEHLLEAALRRVDALIAEGVSTIEIKSGYGLDRDTELKMLRVARQIGKLRPVSIITTFLGAHTVPTGMDADHYIDNICIPTLVHAHSEGLVDAVDGFYESIAFGHDQIKRVFEKAKALGLPVKLHSEQLNRLGGTALATEFQALSLDHLEFANEEDVQMMARASTTAVLLPGAFYALRETQLPPIALLRRYKVPMAVATDWNPGSSPLGSLLLAMNMSCVLFGLTPEEALAGTTREAAKALGLNDRGIIKAGLRADLAVWNVSAPAALSHNIGINPLKARIYSDLSFMDNGQAVLTKDPDETISPQ